MNTNGVSVYGNQGRLYGRMDKDGIWVYPIQLDRFYHAQHLSFQAEIRTFFNRTLSCLYFM
jgi:hypothetical protein